MKKALNIFLCLTTLFLFAFQPVQAADQEILKTRFSDVHALQFFLQYSPNRTPVISAHRGGPLPGFPENCIETFENSLKYAPCVIECDVAMTADSVLIMMHDNSVDRTTNGTGEVSELTYEEIKKLLLVDNENNQTLFTVPTFGEVLEWAKTNTILTVDVKRSVPFSKVIKAIEEHEAESCSIVITYNVDQATTVHELNSELPLSVTIRNEDELKRHLDVGIPAKNLVAFVGVREPSKEHYQLLHGLGIKTILGTMGNLDNKAAKKGAKVYVKLFRNGTDIISTDNVPLASEAVKQYQEKYLEN